MTNDAIVALLKPFVDFIDAFTSVPTEVSRDARKRFFEPGRVIYLFDSVQLTVGDFDNLKELSNALKKEA